MTSKSRLLEFFSGEYYGIKRQIVRTFFSKSRLLDGPRLFLGSMSRDSWPIGPTPNPNPIRRSPNLEGPREHDGWGERRRQGGG